MGLQGGKESCLVLEIEVTAGVTSFRRSYGIRLGLCQPDRKKQNSPVPGKLKLKVGEQVTGKCLRPI